MAFGLEVATTFEDLVDYHVLVAHVFVMDLATIVLARKIIELAMTD